MLDSIKKVIRGKKSLQGVFEKLHQYSLSGLNIGSGAGFTTSGEKFVLEFIKSELNSLGNSRIPVVFDVGANIGDYTLEVNKIFNESVVIHAFEPSKKTFNKLQESLATKRNVYGHQLALSNKTGTITLYSDDDLSVLASVNRRQLDHYNINFNQSEQVLTQTLDDFCKTNEINEIDFLKLDVEGHELSVLQGATELLRNKAITYIQFEFGGTNIDSRTFFQDFYYLLQENYTLYRILSDGLYEIKAYNERYEIFLATNFLAIKKLSTL